MLRKQINISNGETIHYIDKGNNEKVLVLIHGNMSSSIHFNPVIDDLLKNFRVIVPDLRGFGDSTYNSRITSLNDLALDVLELLSKLKIKNYSIAGWSTGGAVAMKIAATQPNSVENLILIESCSHKGYPIFKKDDLGAPIIGEYYHSVEELAKEQVQVKPMVDVLESGNIAVMKAVWDSAIYTVNKPNAADDKIYLSETMKQRNLIDIDWCLTTFNMSSTTNGLTDGDGTIKDIVCPVLSIWSEFDVVVLEYMIDETIKDLTNVRKLVFKNSGHSPLIDCPNQLVNEITSFINE